jgi:hypothetical protein
MLLVARVILLVVGVSVVGCGGYAGPRSIANVDPAVKIPFIRQAVDAGDRSQTTQLLIDLNSDDAAVRFYAIEAIRRLHDVETTYDWREPDRADRQTQIGLLEKRLTSGR